MPVSGQNSPEFATINIAVTIAEKWDLVQQIGRRLVKYVECLMFELPSSYTRVWPHHRKTLFHSCGSDSFAFTRSMLIQMKKMNSINQKVDF